MVPITLISTSSVTRDTLRDVTVSSTEEGASSPGVLIHEESVKSPGGQRLFYTSHGCFIADTEHYKTTSKWDKLLSEIVATANTVWDTPKMRELLAAPLGSPIELTMEEADEIVRLAYGRRPDLAPGKEIVEDVREILGHSLIERLKKVE